MIDSGGTRDFARRHTARRAKRGVCAVVAAATLLALVPAISASATVQSVSGQMQAIAAPPSADLGKVTSATTIRVFPERQRYRLTAALPIDLKAPGTYNKTNMVPVAGLAPIASGTYVNSQMIHVDAPGSPILLDGSVTFGEPIIGVIARSAQLDSSNFLGAPGTTYSTGRGYRGLEFNVDAITISADQKTLRLQSNTTQAFDEVRVLTESKLVTTVLTANKTTIGAGVATVPLTSIPPSAITASSDPSATKSAALSAAKLAGIRVKRMDLAQSSIGSIRVKRMDLDGLPAAKAQLDKILLSDLKVDGGWAPLLAGTRFEFVPLQTLTLADVIGLAQVADLTLAQLGLGSSALGDIPAVAAALGSLSLADVPLTDAAAAGSATDRLQAWCTALGAVTCTAYGIDPSNPSSADGVTVAAVSLAGSDIASADIGSIRVKRMDLSQTELGSIRVKRMDLAASGVGSIRVKRMSTASRPTIVDCTVVDCSDTSTATLGTIPNSAIVGTVLDLLALQGQDPDIDAVLNGLTVDDVFPGLVAIADQSWEDIDLKATPLQNVASPLESVLTYTDAFTIGGSLATKVVVDFTTADGFQYTPGSTKLDGVAVADPVLLSPGVLRFTLTGVAPGAHALAFGNRAGTDLGPKAASVKVTATVGTDTGTATATTPVTVVESFELNGAANDFKVLGSDTLYVSHISSATDTDLYRFDITAQQAQSGTSASLFLGNLAADYDLTLYGPPRTTSGRAADETQTSVDDSGLDASPSRDSVAPDLVHDVPVKSGLGQVAAVAANRGTRDEQIDTGTLVAGTYWLQVSGYNGAFSPKPYVLRERLSQGILPPACQARTLPFTPSAGAALPDPGTYPADLNTIFLVAQQRLTATYGPDRVQPILDNVATVSAMAPDVVGQMVPVDSDPQVAAAYAAWNANRCSPDAAQTVADSISAVVDRIRAARPSLRNVVVVGDDSIIPMARTIDGTAISNESTYADTVNADSTNNELVGSVAGGRILTDDIYGAPRTIDIENSLRQLYLPRLAVGRLVESPEDIAAALQRFVTSGGRLDPLTTAGSSSIVTGYDFLSDGSSAIASTLATKTTPRSSLINETWTRQDLINSLLGANPPDVGSINAHFDQSRALPAAGNASGSEADLFTVDDVTAAGAGKLAGRILFSMGCHSGLSVSDVAVGAPTPDWAQTLTGAGQGALWAGNTGYGYGDTELVAYSEKLMGLFADQLSTDATIGGALTAAKNLYKSETQPLSPYDEKVLQEVVLYGLPMYKPATAPAPLAAPAAAAATAPAAAAPAAPAAPANAPLTSDPTTGLQTASVPVSLTQGSPSGPGTLHVVDTGNGRYYEVDGKTIQVQYRPVQPLVTRDVTEADGQGGLTKVAHGALVTGLTSVDQQSFTPYYSRPLIDQSGHETLDEPVGDAVFPASMLRVNSTVDAQGRETQDLAVVPGQFRPDSTTPGRGTQRLFTGVQTLVHYADPSDTDFTAPTIQRSSGSVVNGTVGFAVETDSTAKRVYVLYKGANTSGAAAWQGVDLVRTAGTNRWTGGGLTTSQEIEFFVQAGDSSGNWGTSNNKASDFLATKPAPNSGPISVALSGAQVSGWYTGAATATVTDTASTLITKSLDGAPFTAYTGPVAVSGDGIHVLDVVDNLGNKAQAVIPVDTSAPTVSATVSPDPAAGAGGWSHGPVDVNIRGVDGGGSGVKTLLYVASGAQAIPLTSVSGNTVTVPITATGSTTVSFVATDSVGKTGALASVVVKIDPNAPTIACSGAPAGWSANDVSVPCTAIDTGSGLQNAADASFSLTSNVPAGTESASASTGTRSVCDVVPNCATAGPVGGLQVDKRGPTVAITAPANGAQIPQNQVATVTFTCADGGSGMVGGSAACNASANGGAPIASGGSIPTSVLGPVTIVVTGVDAVGNVSTATRTVTIVPAYTILITWDSATAVKKGTKITVELKLLDAAGNNISSASHPIVATDVDGGAAPPANLYGGVNRGLSFFLESSHGEGPHYHYLLPTSGYAVGTHVLHFTVDGVAYPTVYQATFKLKA